MPDAITVFVNDGPVTVPRGVVAAAAVASAGDPAFREAVTGEQRGPLCGMGICFECRVCIDGQPHQRSCQVPCREGMRITTGGAGLLPQPSAPRRQEAAASSERNRFDVIVVGAGPAGVAAAVCAAEGGQSVCLVDDNPDLGGQIWRAEANRGPATPAAPWFARVRRSTIRVLGGAQVLGQGKPGNVLIETKDSSPCEMGYGKLIIASGARERFLPFPGWTLPHVMGAGGLQALVKGGLPIEGKRVAVAGTGPLLLAVAAYCCKRGADVCLVAEQARLSNLILFGLGLLGAPSKLWEAVRLRRQFRKAPYLAGCWPIAAEGNGRLAEVVFHAGRKTWSQPCDYLACGFGLVPNVELAALLGCRVVEGAVSVNQWQETSVDNVYCVGEATGIGGLDKALFEGQIAGFAVAERREQAARLFPARMRALRFARGLRDAFALRDELKSLAKPETLVCRCEDVPFARLQPYLSWRDAKLQTRCGMGPCQGRVCGAATEYLFDWNTGAVRPPIFPAKVGALAELEAT